MNAPTTATDHYTVGGQTAYAPDDPNENPVLAALQRAASKVATTGDAYRRALESANTGIQRRPLMVTVYVCPEGNKHEPSNQAFGYLLGIDSQPEPDQCLALRIKGWGRSQTVRLPEGTSLMIVPTTNPTTPPKPSAANRLYEIEALVRNTMTGRQAWLDAIASSRNAFEDLKGAPVHLVNMKRRRNKGGGVIPSLWGWIEELDCDKTGSPRKITILPAGEHDHIHVYPKAILGSQIIPVTTITMAAH